MKATHPGSNIVSCVHYLNRQMSAIFFLFGMTALSVLQRSGWTPLLTSAIRKLAEEHFLMLPKEISTVTRRLGAMVEIRKSLFNMFLK